MPFEPKVNGQIIVEGVVYRIAEHPQAPGMPYAMEGRQSVVYQLVTGQQKQRFALKVFHPQHRALSLVSQASQLAHMADLPGLQVCRRTVLAPQRHPMLLRQHPELSYAIMMPWIEGVTWQRLMLEHSELTPEQSLRMATGLVTVLEGLEQKGAAHCELSSDNLLLPTISSDPSPEVIHTHSNTGTAASPNTDSQAGRLDTIDIELVDVEQMFGPMLNRPRSLPMSSPGYTHKSGSSAWGQEADRFAGAVLLAEILGWCDERVRDKAWGASYFEPGEIQENTERYQLLTVALRDHWGKSIAELFKRAWASNTPLDCASFAEWSAALLNALAVEEVISTIDDPSLIPISGVEQPRLSPWKVRRVPAYKISRPIVAPEAEPQSTTSLSDMGELSAPQISPEASLDTDEDAVALEPAWHNFSELALSGSTTHASVRRVPVPQVETQSGRRGIGVILPVLLLVMLVISGGFVAYQAQETANANATATALAQAATSTARVWATRTAISVEATQTALSAEATASVVQATEIALAFEATQTAIADEATQTTIAIEAEETAIAREATWTAIAIEETRAAVAYEATQTVIARRATETTIAIRATWTAIAVEETRAAVAYEADVTATAWAREADIFIAEDLYDQSVYLYGPDEGSLFHYEDGYIKLSEADVYVSDFVAEAIFWNPYNAWDHTWDYGFLFRRDASGEFRLAINSGGGWSLTLRDNGVIDSQAWGSLQNLNTSDGSTNSVRLVASGDTGYLFVNEEYIASLPLRNKLSYGDVAIATGINGDSEQAGEVTSYEEFYIWEIP